MKKIKVNTTRLQLNKQKIASLTIDQMEGLNGGQKVQAAFTGGCTDGCSPLATAWNCTRTNCSADCNYGQCPC